MKYRPKNWKQAAIIVAIVLVALFFTNVLGIGTNRTGSRIGYMSNNGWHDWTASYMLLNGSLDHTIRPQTTPATYYIEVETESGDISIKIEDENESIIFSETNIGTEAFMIEVTGKIVVHVTADNHRGGFSITAEE